MKKIKFLVIFILVICNNSYSQCFCGSITFSLTIKDVKIKKNRLNYSIEIISSETKKVKKVIVESNFKNDTLSFSISTNAGIDTLDIFIINKETLKKMHVKTIGIQSEFHYFIDLLHFEEGIFVFNLNNLKQCMNNAKNKHRIECDGKIFSLIFSGNNGYNPFSIQPFSLEEFKEK